MRRSTFTFTIEERSQYGDRGSSFSIEETPHDGVGRVLIARQMIGQDVALRTPKEVSEWMVNAPQFGREKLIGMLCKSFLTANTNLWYLGEIRSIFLEGFVQISKVPIFSIPSEGNFRFFLANFAKEDISDSTPWLPFGHDYGPRLFICPNNCDLNNLFIEIIKLLSYDGYNAVAEWKKIYKLCLSRKELSVVLDEVVLTVLPDGEHFKLVSVQSKIIRPVEIMKHIEELISAL